MKSIHALILVSVIWFCLGAFYYPKWKKDLTEATISWDVSGYYHYLPAIFIYKDLRQQYWMTEINQKYLPSQAYDQAFGHHESGNKVNKYSIGQAVLFSPFFLLAHAYTCMDESYPADGYSMPYQIAIWMGSLLFSILGLILLRKILSQYFEDKNIGWTILALGLGTHWAEYAAISNGMNHTWLFTLLCGLILFTIRFYKNTDWVSSIGIGICFGLAVLARPTEIIWMLIPLLWGIHYIKERINFLLFHWYKIIASIIISASIIFMQFVYWKYASGEWIVYTYSDQGFNWFHPNIWRGLMGTNIGWWLYTPIMLVAMFGWAGLYKMNRSVFWPVFITGILGIYITLSWAHWEEGGALGQRNLIQIYPLLAFPLTTLIARLHRSLLGKWFWIILLIANIYYTGWWIHQAHKGGFFKPGQMTTSYFYSVVGRPQPDRDLFKLLDTEEYFRGDPKNLRLMLSQDFEKDTLACEFILPDSTRTACLNANSQFLGPIIIPIDQSCTDWIRLEADFTVVSREWDVWKYAQWIVQFSKNNEVIKTNIIRLQRLLPADLTVTRHFFDVRIPDMPFDQCAMSIWNAESSNTILVDNLIITCFDE